ncbi:cytadherence high molecular weight protein 2 [Candidatus Phytoplasma meliae]|uniref:Cytadherence high molecular weight protein 2 n=1 Tax=Candidatus Phytoplasma meliae TaxID=1848402 RepID=A0ABS5CYJ1_9MOLU|nr:cytadherence high molecular weight protein 2 [Candidatus Phytoplasma meliae]MBP5836036.1 cytadherence high molecular weight protein 2 [Candidatus Phytoplasma meliae]
MFFCYLFLQKLKEILAKLPKIDINEFSNNNNAFISDLAKLQNEYELRKKELKIKYQKKNLEIYQKIEKLENKRKNILKQKNLQNLQNQIFFTQEIKNHKIKDNDRINQLKNLFQKEIENQKKQNYKKEKHLLTQLTKKKENINYLLLSLENQKKQFEIKNIQNHQVLKQNFYTKDFSLNQKNKELIKQLELALQELSHKQENNLQKLEAIYNQKQEIYQKNINKTHKIYQHKLNIHDKFFDVIKNNYENAKNQIQTKQQLFFQKIIPIPFLNQPFVEFRLNTKDQKEKDQLFNAKEENELSYLKKILLWKKKYNYLNYNHQKEINLCHLEKKQQDEIHEKYQKNLNKIHYYQKQKLNYLFSQKKNDIQLQIKQLLNLYLQESALFDNERDYQETFFAYRKNALVLKKNNNDNQIEYYHNFFHNKNLFEFKNKSIILQLKLEKIKIYFNYFTQITQLKKEIGFLENELNVEQLFGKENFIIYQLQETNKKQFFLKETHLQNIYIHYLIKKQVFCGKYHLSQLLNFLKQNQSQKKNKTIILKQLQQEINCFNFAFKNKSFSLEQNILNEINKIIDHHLINSVEEQFNYLSLLHQTKYHYQKEKNLGKIEIITQIIIFYEKQLSFISEIIQKKIIQNKSIKNIINKFFWNHVPNSLEQIYRQINIQKEKFNKQNYQFKQQQKLIENNYQKKIKKYIQIHNQKINEVRKLQKKLLFLWQKLPCDTPKITLDSLSRSQKNHLHKFLKTLQTIAKKTIQDIFVYFGYQDHILQQNNLCSVSKPQNPKIKMFKTKDQLDESQCFQFEEFLLKKNPSRNKIINFFIEKTFLEKQKKILQEIKKKKIQKQQELLQKNHSRKQKIELLNENLADALNNLQKYWENIQKKLQKNLETLRQDSLLQFKNKEKLFFENTKQALKKKNHEIYKNFAFKKEKIYKKMNQKEQNYNKKMIQTDNQIKHNQKKISQKIKISFFKQKFRKMMIQWSLWRQQHQKNKEINIYYRKNKQKIKQQIHFEKNLF